MNGFSESLYYELKPLGIHVSVICPGPVRTDFNRSFADTKPKSPGFLMLAPETVSRLVIRAIAPEKIRSRHAVVARADLPGRAHGARSLSRRCSSRLSVLRDRTQENRSVIRGYRELENSVNR